LKAQIAKEIQKQLPKILEKEFKKLLK